MEIQNTAITFLCEKYIYIYFNDSLYCQGMDTRGLNKT